MTRNENRSGLMLVELASVVALTALSGLLVLPQIQAAREAARRAQCVNNMKQMGLALHNYHSANDCLPMSCVRGPDGHGNGHSGFACILPYLEQSVVYNTYNFHLENWHEANRTTMATKIGTFVCPSSTNGEPVAASDVKTTDGKGYPGQNKFAPGHYGMNWGGVRLMSGIEEDTAYGDDWRGLLLTVVDPESDKPTKNVSFASVTDGLSYTVAIAEKRDSFGWGVGGWSGSEFDVSLDPTEPGKEKARQRAFTGSAHPTGMNVLLGDGSVKFVTAKLDVKTWRGMTTRASGEQIKPDDIK